MSPNLSHISFLKEFCGRRSRSPCLSHLRGTSEIDFCKDDSSTSGKADFNSLSNLIRNSSAGLTFFDILAHSPHSPSTCRMQPQFKLLFRQQFRHPWATSGTIRRGKCYAIRLYVLHLCGKLHVYFFIICVLQVD